MFLLHFCCSNIYTHTKHALVSIEIISTWLQQTVAIAMRKTEKTTTIQYRTKKVIVFCTWAEGLLYKYCCYCFACIHWMLSIYIFAMYMFLCCTYEFCFYFDPSIGCESSIENNAANSTDSSILPFNLSIFAVCTVSVHPIHSLLFSYGWVYNVHTHGVCVCFFLCFFLLFSF